MDLSYGYDVYKAQHVPKIIYIVLEKIEYIRCAKNMDSSVIFHCINGSLEWLDEYEPLIVNLKISLNNGIWDELHKVEDINILIEMFYDWLEDCCKYVINPLKIEKMYTNSQLTPICNIKKQIVDPRSYSKESRRVITEHIRKEMRMIEFETLTCIAHFTYKFLPEEGHDQTYKKDFKLMLEKLAIYMLGYNIEMLYENQDKSQARSCQTIVSRLIDLIMFCNIVIKYDIQNDEDNSFYHKTSTNILTNYNSDNYSNFLNRKINVELGISQTMHNQNDLTTFSKAISLIDRIQTRAPYYSQKINFHPKFVSLVSEKSDKTDNQRENFLYNMYSKLDKYFNKTKPPNIISDKLNQSDLENSICFSPRKKKEGRQSLNESNGELMLNNQNEGEALNDFYESFYKYMNYQGAGLSDKEKCSNKMRIKKNPTKFFSQKEKSNNSINNKDGNATDISHTHEVTSNNSKLFDRFEKQDSLIMHLGTKKKQTGKFQNMELVIKDDEANEVNEGNLKNVEIIEEKVSSNRNPSNTIIVEALDSKKQSPLIRMKTENQSIKKTSEQIIPTEIEVKKKANNYSSMGIKHVEFISGKELGNNMKSPHPVNSNLYYSYIRPKQRKRTTQKFMNSVTFHIEEEEI
jgi:hypothetical protein